MACDRSNESKITAQPSHLLHIKCVLSLYHHVKHSVSPWIFVLVKDLQADKENSYLEWVPIPVRMNS